jgi:hypothetical protein
MIIDKELLDLINAVAPFFAIILFSIFFLVYLNKNEKRQKESEEKRIQNEKEVSDQLKFIQEQSLKISKKQEEFQENTSSNILSILKENVAKTEQQAEFQKKSGEELLNQLKNVSTSKEHSAKDSGGYIVLELTNEQISLFQDLFKGFEDFATLRGYTISLSIDNSIPNRVGFKFTIQDTGVIVSTQTVWGDIKDYLDRIKNEESLENLPIVIPVEDHKIVLKTLQSRISFLRENYQLQKSAIKIYERLLDKLNSPNTIISSLPPVFIQTEKSNYRNQNLLHHALKEIEVEDITIVENKVKIGKSFVERKNQLDSISKLIKLIARDEIVEDDKKDIAVLNLEKVKSEIEEEGEPDKARVKKWLEKAKPILDEEDFEDEVLELRDKVYDLFNLESIE